MRDGGYAPLGAWVAAHVQRLHAPPVAVDHLVTCGNTNGLDLALRSLLNPGDVVLTEEYTYAATLQALRPMGAALLGVPSDEHGPLPAALRGMLEQRRAAGLPAVRVFYCVPVSGNPTGVSWSEERKAAMYSLACEFDFLLLEDDAYFYLQFNLNQLDPSSQPGLSGLGRSLLSYDTQGRVVRVDTFSKFLAPVRYATCPCVLWRRYARWRSDFAPTTNKNRAFVLDGSPRRQTSSSA